MRGGSGEFQNPYEGIEAAGLRNEDFMFRVVRESGTLQIEKASALENVTGKTDFKVTTDEGEKVKVQFKTHDLSIDDRLKLLEREIIPVVLDETQVNYAKTEAEWRVYVLNEFVGQFSTFLPLWRQIYYHQGRVESKDVEKALRSF